MTLHCKYCFKPLSNSQILGQKDACGDHEYISIALYGYSSPYQNNNSRPRQSNNTDIDPFLQEIILWIGYGAILFMCFLLSITPFLFLLGLIYPIILMTFHSVFTLGKNIKSYAIGIFGGAFISVLFYWIGVIADQHLMKSFLSRFFLTEDIIEHFSVQFISNIAEGGLFIFILILISTFITGLVNAIILTVNYFKNDKGVKAARPNFKDFGFRVARITSLYAPFWISPDIWKSEDRYHSRKNEINAILSIESYKDRFEYCIPKLEMSSFETYKNLIKAYFNSAQEPKQKEEDTNLIKECLCNDELKTWIFEESVKCLKKMGILPS